MVRVGNEWFSLCRHPYFHHIPHRIGIALRLPEWQSFKEAADCLHRDHPLVANFVPYFMEHSIPENITACKECNPDPTIDVNSMLMHID